MPMALCQPVKFRVLPFTILNEFCVVGSYQVLLLEFSVVAKLVQSFPRKVSSKDELARCSIFESIAGQHHAGGEEVVALAGLPVGDDLAAGLTGDEDLGLVLVGAAVVVEGVVLDGEVGTGEDVDTRAAGTEMAVLKRDGAFVALDLQGGLHVAGQAWRC